MFRNKPTVESLQHDVDTLKEDLEGLRKIVEKLIKINIEIEEDK